MANVFLEGTRQNPGQSGRLPQLSEVYDTHKGPPEKLH